MWGLKLMVVVARPGDETSHMGGALARYAAKGDETYLVTATHGDPWSGDAGASALMRSRIQGMRDATRILGVRETFLLGYREGKLEEVDPALATARVVEHLRRVKPHVVLTFDPMGPHAHADQEVIGQLTTDAVALSGDDTYEVASRLAPHGVARLYHLVERGSGPVTRVDTSPFAGLVRRAAASYGVSPMAARFVGAFDAASPPWRCRDFRLAWSAVDGDQGVESDLFQGLGGGMSGARVA